MWIEERRSTRPNTANNRSNTSNRKPPSLDSKSSKFRQLKKPRSSSFWRGVSGEKGRDLRLCCDFFGLAFLSPVRDACGPRGSSEYTPRAGVSGGVRQLQCCDPGDHAGNFLSNALRL